MLLICVIVIWTTRRLIGLRPDIEPAAADLDAGKQASPAQSAIVETGTCRVSETCRLLGGPSRVSRLGRSSLDSWRADRSAPLKSRYGWLLLTAGALASAAGALEQGSCGVRRHAEGDGASAVPVVRWRFAVR